MITFCLSVVALLLGYLLYARFAEKIFEIDPNRQTPAISMRDGVDYVPMSQWKIFLIQFLNIAGLGPIFGAVAGAMWGPVAFLWIVLGSIFAGGVHDYFSGMLSLKHNGESITEITGRYLGTSMKQFMRVFTLLLMVMVGAVFIMGPAKILDDMTGGYATATTWVWLILIYYILSTVLPIDKLIGKLYPVFGFALLFMALGLVTVLFTGDYVIPELTLTTLTNMRTNAEAFPLFPMLFVTIACGAISGFHASQSPMMARCMTNERQGRSIFYGAMITEGVLALIWAALSMSFFGGIRELNDTMVAQQGNAAYVVNIISNTMLGKVGGILALLGVVAAPITSGDTAFRSARLIVADFTRSNQSKIKNRLLLSLPLFVIGFGLTLIDFGIVWRYFAWTNQTLATIVLWTVTVYLIKEQKFFWISLVPAVFMTVVCVSYILVAPEGFSLPTSVGYVTGIGVALVLLIITLTKVYRIKNRKLEYTS